MTEIVIINHSPLFEQAALEDVWEKYGRNMSILDELGPDDDFTISKG